ncbi:5739_t:CDS:2, partial [Cetraspora pellucida]
AVELKKNCQITSKQKLKIINKEDAYNNLIVARDNKEAFDKEIVNEEDEKVFNNNEKIIIDNEIFKEITDNEMFNEEIINDNMFDKEIVNDEISKNFYKIDIDK